MNKNVNFSKQFLVAPKTYTNGILDDWIVKTISESYILYAHKELSVSISNQTPTMIFGLGVFLDPFDKKADDQAIVQKLASESSKFSHLEENLSMLGGRWALIATINGETRIYHDATGQKPVFLFGQSSDKMFLCSHPSLLTELNLTERDLDLVNNFEKYKNSGSWPIEVVPYSGVKQLLPNHYCSLYTRKIVRYWPNKHLTRIPCSEAAAKMTTILVGLIESATHRRECVLNLTGGYDSRLILACSESQWAKIKFSTSIRQDSPHHDVSIPKKIMKKFDLDHTFLKVSSGIMASSNTINELLQNNVGGMFYDPSLQTTALTANFVGQKLSLPGLMSEVNRCYYYPSGEHPENVSPEYAAHVTGFEGNPIALKGFSIWLDNLPDQLHVNILDLLYWEHRCGVWSACGLTLREALIDQVPPMNCRHFLELGLSTSVEYRKAPYELIKTMTSITKPELLAIDYNHDWVDDWHSFRLKRIPIPWRLKSMLGWTNKE